MSAGDWTFESEAAALASLRAAVPGADQRRAVLVYARQSVSDFDQDGGLRGPSLQQQVDAVSHRAEFASQRIEVFQDADRSGKETSRRGDYLRMLERVRTAAPGEIAAVASYDIDRLHRNDLEFFRFMAEMAEHGILVFDSQGLVSAVDQLPWKVKAIVAQEERVKVGRRVRDNLRYLKRTGHLLGVIPQGYRRVDGVVVEDPEVAPGIRQIFELYATGRFSFQTLADHLNSLGIRPKRGPAKAKHNRPAAIIFTGDVLKDILDNPAYLARSRSTAS